MGPARFGPYIFLSALLFPFPAFAQQSTQNPNRDPQAVSILQQAVAAMGSVPTDSTASGTIAITSGSTTETGNIQVLTRGTDQTLERIDAPGLSSQLVYSHGLARASYGTTTRLLQTELALTSQSALFPLPLLSAAVQDPDVSITFIGRESLDGFQTYHIQLLNTFMVDPGKQPLAAFSMRNVWLDSMSYLPRRIAYVMREARGPVYPFRVQIIYSNYERQGNVVFPMLVEKIVNGVPYAKITITTVSLDIGLSDANFPVQ